MPDISFRQENFYKTQEPQLLVKTQLVCVSFPAIYFYLFPVDHPEFNVIKLKPRAYELYLFACLAVLKELLDIEPLKEAVYNYARTADQVMQDYNSGAAARLGD